MHTLAEPSYLQKIEAARQQVELDQFPDMWDVNGRRWPGVCWHVIYSPCFIGYFLYKITGLLGGSDYIPTETWWGLELEAPPGYEHSECYEQPLPPTEVKAWLALNYSHLAADDYEHLINVLWFERTPDGCTVYHLRNHYNRHLALTWLTEQHARAVASDTTSAASPTTQTALPINPWVPLLTSSLKLDNFYSYLQKCGLLTDDRRISPLGRGKDGQKARIAPWVGALRALTKEHVLDPNFAAICRALANPAGELGIKISESALREPSKKAEDYRQAYTETLHDFYLLRN